ncbi:hypothetical protein QY049_15760 [Bradyrhizobium sp. WYCCWR 13022]|uniref:hypothetical protein n=1 Tax=unclassified Bradyrhizobium TaxID=2631580 RepID=UPI00263BCB59|nr:hypothetical protein [Bradyrhizobium sp. WYCCWR 13022]MDN4984659.1 hypothetical protein [Bradyrhizobium sp. WYCCWR 13022]
MNKGIKRLGVIASVLWVVVGGLWTRSIVIKELGHFAISKHQLCLEMHSIQDDGTVPKDTDWAQCNRQFDADWSRDVTNGDLNIENAMYTFVPLILAWLAAYTVLWLGRWVIAGFRKPA